MSSKASIFVAVALLAACGGNVESGGATGGAGGAGGSAAGGSGGTGAGGVAGAAGGGVAGMAGYGGFAGAAGGGFGGFAGAAGGGFGGFAGAAGGGFGGFAGAAGGGFGGFAGAGGSVGCSRTHDTLSFKVGFDSGQKPPSCNPGGAMSLKTIGQVVKTTKNTFVLDTCPPNADCMASFMTVSVAAKGLELWVPMNAFVEVEHVLQGAWGFCTSRSSVRNVPSWGGMKNTVSGSTQVYFAGTEGQLQHSGAPFAVKSVPLGCGGGPSCGQPADDYALSFNVGPGAPGKLVKMGTQTTLMTPMPMTVRNLRSFVSGMCDDYWDWAWWAAWVPTSSGTK
jgi:hypothetical protein